MWSGDGLAQRMMVSQVVNNSLLHAPILALPDPDRPFSVFGDASDFSIEDALLQTDVDG